MALTCSSTLRPSLVSLSPQGHDLKSVEIFGKEVDYIHAQGRRGFGGYSGFPVSTFGPENAFFVGITTSGYVYLVGEDLQYDGDLFNKPRITSSHGFSEGVVFRFESKNVNLGKVLSEFLRSEEIVSQPSLTCVKGLCDIVKSLELLNEESVSNLTPLRLMRSLIVNDFADYRGDLVRKDILVFEKDDIKGVAKKIRVMTPISVSLTLMARPFKFLFGAAKD